MDFHTCVATAAPTATSDSLLGTPPTKSVCNPGEVQQVDGTCTASSEPAKMTFYMYRARDDAEYHMENVNMASLTGVMWYLQNEVVYVCPRKFEITRIVRYLITMKNTKPLFTAPLHYQFGQFVQFDSGMCTWNRSHCETLWNTMGYVVGCQPLDVTSPMLPNYAGPPEPVWYSLPGKCPAQEYGNKTATCVQAMPGGECDDPDGSKNCTWSIKYAGEVRLDDLSGITNYTSFCEGGGTEYDKTLDMGTGVDFWNQRRDPVQCRERIAKVEEKFQAKYPSWPVTLGDPPCDWYR
jgi:hypothetical protein